jgi:dTDP-4-amino-4,6-dideoxygalactose transaminase
MNTHTDREDIPFARPSIGQEEIDAVSRVLRSGWLTTGRETLAFEEEFGAYVSAPHALAVSSATAGLHLALEATGTGPGDTVIVPSLTFTATAEVARYLGAEIVFADVSPDGLLMDPRDVERRASEVAERGGRVSAIIVVHLAGQVAPMEEFRRIARSCNAALIEDAAHAFPCRTPDGYAGTLADAGVYSFYANKTITTGEGGMVVTASSTVAARIRTMRLHGIDREAWDRFKNPRGSWQYQVVEAGYKYNMTDIAAAIGRVQLKKAEAFLSARRKIVAAYLHGLAAHAASGDVVLPVETESHAWHLFILRLNSHRYHRDTLARHLQEVGVGISVHYTPLHRMTYWARRYPHQVETLPNTDSRYEEIVSLPLYPDLPESQQKRVIEGVVEVLENLRNHREAPV